MGRNKAAATLVAVCAICLVFVLTSLAGERWDTKRIRGGVGAAMVKVFDAPLAPSLDTIVVPGHCASAHESYPYRIVVEVASWFFPRRTTSLRAISLLFGCVFLGLMYGLGAALYDRNTGLVFALALATSPYFVEMARAYGYVSMALAIAAGVLLLSARQLRASRDTAGDLGWAAACALLCLCTFSVYAVGRLVLFVAVVTYLLRIGRRFRSAAVFAGVLVLPVAIGLVASPDLRRHAHDAVVVGPEWLSDPDQYHTVAEEFDVRMRRNVPDALGQMTGLQPVNFSDFGADPRLVPLTFVPLLLFGVILSGVRRSVRDLFVLACFVAFLGIPLFSSGLPARRVIFATIPVYLLVAAGGVGLYRRVLAQGFGVTRRRLVAALAAAWFLGTCLAGIYQFVHTISRSESDVNAASQEVMAGLVREALSEVAVVIYAKGVDDVFFGSPPLVNGDGALEFARKIQIENADPNFWNEWSRRTGQSVGFYYLDEGSCSDGGIVARVFEKDLRILLQASVPLETQLPREADLVLCGEVFTWPGPAPAGAPTPVDSLPPSAP